MTQTALPVVRTVAALRAQVSAWKREGLRVAMVPTMGALHEGHLSLVRLGNQKADRTVASIFVNPAQFAPHEDFDAYPRGEDRDSALLAAAGCALLFAPTVGEMYPDGFATTVNVATGVSEPLEGVSRPHFFGGVATVVSKLLNQCRPDVAIFGEKDYQQLLVVRRLTEDLALTPTIVPVPTLREADGLAMSSRNRRLSPSGRALAPTLHATMRDIGARIAGGADPAPLLAEGAAALTRAGFGPIDYLELRHAETLAPAQAAPARLFAAAYLDGVRLIDNIAVG